MSHQQPPQYGQSPQQPGPVEEPKPKKKTGRKIAIGVGGVFALFIVIGVLAGGEEESTEPVADTPVVESEPAAEPADEAVEENEAEPVEEEPVEEEPAEEEETVPESQPVTVEATATEFQPSIAHDGGEFTSVEVTIVNGSDGNVEVNPLSFALVADDGSKTNAVLGEDERQIDTLTLSPGQQVSGVLTGEGSFTVASVEFNPDMFGGDTYIGEVGQ